MFYMEPQWVEGMKYCSPHLIHMTKLALPNGLHLNLSYSTTISYLDSWHGILVKNPNYVYWYVSISRKLIWSSLSIYRVRSIFSWHVSNVVCNNAERAGKIDIWVATWENVHSVLCTQWKLKTACAFIQSDQSIRYSRGHYKNTSIQIYWKFYNQKGNIFR